MLSSHNCLQRVITNGLNFSELIRNWKGPVDLISCERNLLPLGDKSQLCSDYLMNLKELHHAQHSYTHISKVTNFGPLLYRFFHGFWYIGLTMARKMGQNSYLIYTAVLHVMKFF